MSPAIWIQKTLHLFFNSSRNKPCNKFWTKWRNTRGCQRFKFKSFHCKCYLWLALSHPKKAEIFCLESCLLTFCIISMQYSAKKKALHEPSSPEQCCCLPPLLRRLTGFQKGRRVEKICTSDAALKGQTRNRFVLKWQTLQLKPPFRSGLLPSRVGKQSLGLLSLDIKDAAIAGSRGSSLGNAEVCTSKSTEETALSMSWAQQMCRLELLAPLPCIAHALEEGGTGFHSLLHLIVSICLSGHSGNEINPQSVTYRMLLLWKWPEMFISLYLEDGILSPNADPPAC